MANYAELVSSLLWCRPMMANSEESLP